MNFASIKAAASSVATKAKALVPNGGDIKVVSLIAVGAAAFIAVNAVTTAVLSDVGHDIIDLF